MRRRAHPEQDVQRALCELWAMQWPGTWAQTFHCPSGLYAKSHALAAIMVGIGFKSGVPDLICIAARGGYRGLALEIKADGHGRPSNTQREWLDAFAGQRWYSGVACGLDESIAFVRRYHELEINTHDGGYRYGYRRG